MRGISRLIRHRRTPRRAGPRIFSSAALARFHEIIALGQQQHRAHLYLAIETALSSAALLTRCTPRERASQVFAAHGLRGAPQRAGVLLYLNLADRRIELIADRGFDGVIPPEAWQAVCSRLTQACRNGEFVSGVQDALHEVNQLLASAMPAAAGPTLHS